MVAKKKTSQAKTKNSRVKVGNLKVSKETVKDLTDKEAKYIKGGFSGGCYDGIRGVPKNNPGVTDTANCN
jgi:hypothetical protein